MIFFRAFVKIGKLFLISCLLSGMILFVLGLVAGYFLFRSLSEDLPSLAGVSHKPSITTKIYDRNGVVLEELFAEELRAEIVPFSQIPKHTLHAFIAIEDERFYSHYGIDPKRILGAIVADIKEKRAVQGASTITQQLARNLFLTAKKTVKRKLQEVIMAIRLERTYTKNDIIALYLNQIFFGGRVHGIASAARHYFGKRVEELNVAESAMLAGMVKGPNLYNPFNSRQPNAWRERQKLVLRQMFNQGYISKASYDKEKEREMLFKKPGDSTTQLVAPYFVEHVKKILLEKFGYEKVYAEGLRVHTSLDLEVHKMAEEAFLKADVFKKKPIEDFPKFQGAMLVFNPQDGSILSMIGGRDFNLQKFNRATQAHRQPGSSFKPFNYAAAFEAGMSPNEVMIDEPYSKYDSGSGKWWSPKNYGGTYNGPVTLAYALSRSLNVISVKLAERIGVDKIIALAQRCGIKSPLIPNLTLALGSSDVTVLEIVSAYGAFANQGIHVEPRAVLRVEDAEGHVIWSEEVKEKEALREDVAFLVADTMRGTVEQGTGTKAAVEGFQIAGKTGTNQDFIDAWFIGYTTNVVLGVNIGYNDRQSMGKGETGGKLAAPIAGAFFKKFLAKYPAEPFKKPADVLSLSVCRESGLKAGPNCTRTGMLAFSKDNAPVVVCNAHLGGDAYYEEDPYVAEEEAAEAPPEGAGAEILHEAISAGGY